MFRARLGPLARASAKIQGSYLSSGLRQFSTSPAWLQSLPVQVTGQGTGTIQTISVKDKPYKFSTDTYTVLGGKDSHPSPVAYSLASLGSCNQVTGFVVAKDHGLTLGEWHVTVEGQLPTAVLVGGKEGNPNWESVNVKVRVQTNATGGNDDPKFKHFVAEVERRCPITALFKLSGVAYTSEWVNEPL
ncbi:OsmC/Ohr family [Dactylonectria estremocensis]|uniref:OsmC/Ohr family n=1 Tax=Dactylonectria estremocensis TaxID=1079267 RepID=A0A9P9DKV9_9HYPO|nr:OsmC/Ohr family [Dactylonectria estremocensis]